MSPAKVTYMYIREDNICTKVQSKHLVGSTAGFVNRTTCWICPAKALIARDNGALFLSGFLAMLDTYPNLDK